MIKIRNSNKTYDAKVDIISWRSIIQLSGEKLPTTPVDFDVLNDEGTIVDYFEGFNVVYDKGENYIQFTNDTNIYYNYLITDENGYIIRTEISTEKLDEFLYQSGQGKKYKEPTLELFDADGAPLYKIADGELVETTDAEKRSVIDANYAEELKNAKIAKQAEISSTCEALIVKGVEINGESFAYELDDQNNILNNTNLALQTGLDVPYHADGKPCRLFTSTEIVSIYIAQEHNLTHNVTYNNQLKLYVDTLTTVEEVNAVQYGQELTGDYLATYQLIMAQADALTQAFVSRASI